MFPWRNSGTDNHELRVSSDILPGSVPCTFSHSLVQPPVHICPQSHGHLYVVLSGPEQWTLQFFLLQRCKEDEITEIVFNKGLVVWRVMMTVKYGTDIFWEVFFSLAGDRFFFYLEALCILIFTKTVYKLRKMLCLITILLLSELNTQGKCWAVIFKRLRSLWEVSCNQKIRIANPVLITIF